MLGILLSAAAARRWRDGSASVGRELAENDELKAESDVVQEQDEIFGEPVSLETVMAEFKLSNDTLRRMMAHMSRNMDKGLEGGPEKSTIAMLPSFVPELPDGTEEGRYLAMDLGGTNLRVMLMDIIPGQELKMEQFNTRTPNWAMQGTGEQLFDFIANCLGDFLIEKGVAQDNLPLGFTFSYPCDQRSLRSATLLRWTKGIKATGVVGEDVVELLEKSIAKRGDIKVNVVALINDTVGTMVAASHQAGGQCDIGAIIATGTNASYMEHTDKIIYGLSKSKEAYPYEGMIIDTEWGGFGDRCEAEYIFTQYDKILDSRSEHPGVNTFDKLVAGKCMGEVVRLVLERLTRAGIIFNGKGSETLFQQDAFPTKFISEILSDESGSYANARQIMGELGIDHCSFSDMLLLKEVCIVVSRRCANLGAAAIACALNRIRRPNMVVGIDGSTYKYHPFFEFWVHEKLKELVDPGLKFTVLQTGDGSGKGAALITAIAQRLQRKQEGRPLSPPPPSLTQEEPEAPEFGASPLDIFKDTLPFTEAFNGGLQDGEIFISIP